MMQPVARFLAAAVLALPAAAAWAHPGHPGHDDDPYRMEAPGFLWEQLGLALPFLALGAAVALTRGPARVWIGGLTAAVVAAAGITHFSSPQALVGMVAVCALHTTLGGVCAKMLRAIAAAGKPETARAVVIPKGKRNDSTHRP